MSEMEGGVSLDVSIVSSGCEVGNGVDNHQARAVFFVFFPYVQYLL